MQHLMALGAGTEWEMIFVLSGLYGLRRNEVLGLRWHNVDLKNKCFSVVEQLPVSYTHLDVYKRQSPWLTVAACFLLI